MKKNLLYLLALSAMVMGGCSKSEIDEGTINSTNAITFETSANKLTKAPVLDESNVTNYKFGLYAYYTGQDTFSVYSLGDPNFMYDEDVEYTDGAWSYSPLKYWPNAYNDKISFFGYLPKGVVAAISSTSSGSSVTPSVTNGALPTIAFTQEVINPKKMVDLTAAQVLDQKKTTAAVNLPFKHILTRLKFTAKTDETLDAATKINVTALRILGTKNSAGSTNQVIDNSCKNTDSRFYSAANYQFTTDATTSGWDYSKVTPTQVEDAMELTKIFNNSNKISNTEAQTPLFTTGQYLFLIPPHGKDGVDSESDLRFQIEYTVTTVDAPMADIVTSKTAHFSMPNGSLVEGKAYNAIVTISLDAVKVTATPEDWTEEDAYTVTAGEAQTAADIEAAITAAYATTYDALTVTYKQNPADALDITIPEPASDDDLNIYLDLPYQTGKVNITTNDKYKGELTINAPNATVTVNGGTYTNLTVWTYIHTLIIADDAIVNGLTINKGNVAIEDGGKLNGTVVRGAINVDTETYITYTSDTALDNALSLGSKIINSATPTTYGVYGSVDGGAWTSITNDTNTDDIATGSSIKVIRVGSEHRIRQAQLKKIAEKNFETVDLSDVRYESTTEDCTFPDYFCKISPSRLRHIMLPSNINKIYGHAFEYCTALERVDLSQDALMQGSVFYGCTNLKYIDFSKVMLDASSTLAFYGCTGLTSNIKLREDITIIAGSLFWKCSNIPSIEIGPNVTEIGVRPFRDCSSLRTITFADPEKINTIGSYVFYNTAISIDTWPFANVDAIPTATFQRCSNIPSFTIPAHVTTLGDMALAQLDVKSINIPNTVTTLGKNVFSSSMNLENVTFEDGDSPVKLGNAILSSTTNLKTVRFPRMIESFNGRALEGCLNLHTIICPSIEVPVVFESEFGVMNEKVYASLGSQVPEGTAKILYVPYGSKSLYESDTYPNETLNGDGTTENYWKTVLQDECGFKVVELDADGNIPTVE